MKKHLNTQFRQFILERIKQENDEDESQDDLEEVLPDDETSEEPTDDEFDFTELDDENNNDDKEDNLIEELHNRYKKLKKIYEYRLHQRRRTTL